MSSSVQQIAGVGASDMISELALAIESGMNAEDIALTIHHTHHWAKLLWIQLNWL